ncbi:MAG: hypothetical protein IIT46_17725 [Lachnospiraceae bacterium]|nr:hypothetical protein [Lachnospiraceae bacterium]
MEYKSRIMIREEKMENQSVEMGDVLQRRIPREIESLEKIIQKIPEVWKSEACDEFIGNVKKHVEQLKKDVECMEKLRENGIEYATDAYKKAVRDVNEEIEVLNTMLH